MKSANQIQEDMNTLLMVEYYQQTGDKAKMDSDTYKCRLHCHQLVEMDKTVRSNLGSAVFLLLLVSSKATWVNRVERLRNHRSVFPTRKQGPVFTPSTFADVKSTRTLGQVNLLKFGLGRLGEALNSA